MNTKRIGSRIACLMVVIGLAACDSENIRRSAQTPEERVAERAQARSSAVVDADFAKVYGYYTPGYRSSVQPEDFVVRFRISSVKWVSANFVDVDCEESICTARIDVEYLLNEPLRGVSEHRSTRRISETWINVDEEWYFVDKQ